MKSNLAVVILFEKISSNLGRSSSVWILKLQAISLITTLGLILFTGSALANLLEVKKAVEEAQCKKLATAYAKDPSSSTVISIAQLQICLAQTLKATASPAIPRNFDIQPPSPSTPSVDTILPKQPTPPTPPSSIKIR